MIYKKDILNDTNKFDEMKWCVHDCVAQHVAIKSNTESNKSIAVQQQFNPSSKAITPSIRPAAISRAID